MKDWVARGLPLWRKRSSLEAPIYLIRGAALPALAACVAAVLHEITVSALFLAIAGLLLLTAKFSSETRGKKSAGLELTHAI